MKNIMVYYSLFLTVINISIADAALTLEPTDWGAASAASDTAEIAIERGEKPFRRSLNIVSDAGGISAAVITFDLPSFAVPATSARLRLEVKSAGSVGASPFVDLPLQLSDVNDFDRVFAPVWDFDDWRSVTTDLTSGKVYGNFDVRAIDSNPAPDATPVLVDIPLTDDAIFDINLAAGGVFAIGLGAVESGWAGEGEGVSFLNPDQGGLVQLILEPVPLPSAFFLFLGGLVGLTRLMRVSSS